MGKEESIPNSCPGRGSDGAGQASACETCPHRENCGSGEQKQKKPESCPGAASEDAGKADACAGCPMKAQCASKKLEGPDPDLAIIMDRMKKIKKKVIVLSGKGGVGKSTVSTQLGFFLSLKNTAGILDIDICGPSIPILTGVTGEEIHDSTFGWQPVYVTDSLGVISIGFLLGSEDDPVIWRGPRKNGMIKQFLKDTWWDDLDYLVIDTPPGTSDEHLSITQFLKDALDGAVIVTTPQEVSLSDVRKEINFCRKVGLNILGVIENMSGFVCPNCAAVHEIFSPSTGGAEKMCADMGVPFLGKLPLDPSLTAASDDGLPWGSAANVDALRAEVDAPDQSERPGVRAFADVVAKLKAQLES